MNTNDLFCKTELNSIADILIVDDIPNNIRFLSKMLVERGYEVRKALSGPMALTAVQTTLPDLILLDINMPEMSGYQVCQQLKNNPQTASIPVIFITALDDVADKVKAFQVGGADYITKPFQIEEVLARIQQQLTIQKLQFQLQEQNRQLKETLDELRSTQATLIQKEKMAGLGKLVAGIAHEFNNPVSFISGNIAPARRYVQDLLELIRLYQAEFPEPSPPLQAVIEEMDLNFLLADLNKLMDSMQRGAERIRSLVLALRIFSHLDESEIKPVNLQEGIDSALMLVQHRIKPSAKRPAIKIVKDYGGIPPVTCSANQINQVFLNLLVNAIDALETGVGQQSSHPDPTIWIQTRSLDPETVLVTIRDNGIGIAADVHSHLFDPFFTTKPVGQGTGLGLSVSYQIIVEKHRGRLRCDSTPGQGATFSLEIPVRKPYLESLP